MIDWFIDWLIDWILDELMEWLIDWLIDWSFASFILRNNQNTILLPPSSFLAFKKNTFSIYSSNFARVFGEIYKHDEKQFTVADWFGGRKKNIA